MTAAPTILLIGASRGLGHAIAVECIAKGWNVVGTVRAGSAETPLHALAGAHPGRVEIEVVDVCEPSQIAALGERLAGRLFDVLFVNAGTTNSDPTQTIGEVATDDFMHVMLTNTLGPMRVVETLECNVQANGIVAVMSSGQGSIGNNEGGQREVYRASKAALNMCMRSFAARHVNSSRAMLLMAPGWVKTALGGDNAPLGIEDSIPGLVDVLLSQQGHPGLRYLDYRGRVVPW